MPLTPQDVEAQTFKERFKGYDMDEVDAFLDRVVARLTELQSEREELHRRLEEARSSSGESEHLLQRTLLTAQRTADQMVEEAQAEAERVVSEAQAEAERVLGNAREEMALERERLETEAAQLARTIEELKQFRDRYQSSLRRAIEYQLERLEQAVNLPEVPAEVEGLAQTAVTSAAALHGPDPVVAAAAGSAVGPSALDAPEPGAGGAEHGPPDAAEDEGAAEGWPRGG